MKSETAIIYLFNLYDNLLYQFMISMLCKNSIIQFINFNKEKKTFSFLIRKKKD